MSSTKPEAPQPEEIGAARKAAGLMQAEAADRIGYTERACQDWEGGRRGMRRALVDLFLARTQSGPDPASR